MTKSDSNGETTVLCGDEIDPTDPNPSELWVVKPSIEVPRTAIDMANCVAPLLRHCKKVLFVDPHYDPANRRHNLPLREFLSIIGSRDPQSALPSTIEYHTSDKNKDGAGFQANLDTWVKPVLPGTARMTVVRWNVDELHNRYILTDRGGVMFGTGLDQDDSVPPAEDTVTLLDDDHCAELIVKYSSSTTVLSWLDDTYEV